MGQRLDLHSLLLTFVSNVYFQPPEDRKMEYPCIIYKRDFAETRFADDLPYNHELRYLVTVIDRDPDSDIPSKVAAMRKSRFNRHFTTQNLNHDVFHVYF